MYADLDCLKFDNHCVLHRSSQTSVSSWICCLLTIICVGKLQCFSEFTWLHFRFLPQHLSNVNAISSMARAITSVMQMPRFISRHRNKFHVCVSVRYHCLFQDVLPAIFSATSCPACFSLKPLLPFSHSYRNDDGAKSCDNTFDSWLSSCHLHSSRIQIMFHNSHSCLLKCLFMSLLL